MSVATGLVWPFSDIAAPTTAKSENCERMRARTAKERLQRTLLIT